MKKIALATAALVALAATPALAQDAGNNWYGSVGYSNLSAEDDDADLGAVTGRFGGRFGSVFGAEVEGSIGVNDADLGGGLSAKLKHQLAAYAVGYLPVGETFDVFGRVGVGTAEIEIEGPGASASGSDQSFNYGVGAQWFWDGANGLRGDWTRHDFDDGGEADMWTISYVRRF
ncbi:MAG TPA: porin family protein [Caulobacteraceae bacterium]|nr:porin family protein [Caulobacteraceae bacterium]